MIRLAAEVADGIVLWACPSSYIRDVVVPEIAAVRWATGRDMTGFDVDAAVPAAATDDVPAAASGIREKLHRYFGLPFLSCHVQCGGLRRRRRGRRRCLGRPGCPIGRDQ
jgi:hypothetical protein